MPTYADLRPEVQAVVDRKAQELVARDGGELHSIREQLAARVTTTTYRPSQGTGH